MALEFEEAAGIHFVITETSAGTLLSLSVSSSRARGLVRPCLLCPKDSLGWGHLSPE